MCVAHRRGNAAIGDNAGEVELLDAALAQHPFEPRGMECGVGDFLHVDIRGSKLLDKLLAPAPRREVARLEKWTQRSEMRRDDRLASAAWHEREQSRDGENSVVARGARERCEAVGQGGDVGARLASTAVSRFRMQEVVLQVAEDESSGLLAHAGSTITLPS